MVYLDTNQKPAYGAVMPTISYFGTDLTLDWAISYARVSSAQQTLVQGGGGIDRQLEAFRLFTTTTGIPEDTSFRLIDDGRSASKGRNIKGGSLGLFLDSIRQVKPGTALVLESFSRLTRLPIDEALGVFFDIVTKGGVTLITLQDRRAYTKASLRGDKGQIYQISAAMQAARDLAENISYYSAKSWKDRRGSATNVVPSWIVKQDGELVACPIKKAIIQRAWTMGLTTGVNKIVHTFNSEGAPTLNERKRQREALLWSTGTLTKIFRGRQVLGQQEVAHYVDGKRVVAKGQYIDAYPAIISLDLWNLMQAKLDSRQSGISTGRNVTKMTNLFGDIARCECGSRMKVHRRGDHGKYVYLGCSTRFVGGCDNSKFYRLDKIESKLLPRMVDTKINDQPSVDPAAVLEGQIISARTKAAEIEKAYQQSMTRSGELAERTQAKLEADYQRKSEEVIILERRLAALRSTKPVAEVQSMIGGVLGAALAGDVWARTKIATAMPEVLRKLVCRKDGTLRVEFRSSAVKVTWTTTLSS
jgi:hypothetical protein